MGSSQIIIPGLTDDDKVPGDYGYTRYGVGGLTSGSSKLLLVGNKLTAGSRAVESGPWPVYSVADADAQFGAGSELARMCYAALAIDGVDLWAYPVTEATGTQGTWTVTHSGTLVGSGQNSLRIGKKTYVYTTITDVQACSNNCAAAVNADFRAGWTAAVGAGPAYTVTITTRQKGTRANYSYAKIDTSLQASGLTTVLAGGTAHGEIIPATGGTGADDVTTCLGILAGKEWPMICFAQNDAVNEALYETHVDGEAATTIDHLEHIVIGHNGTSATATSLANTTCNAYRVELVWCGYQPVSPVEFAAEFAAHRAVTESSNPNPCYDDYVFKCMAPLETADIPNHATIKALLNNGVSPVYMNGSDPAMARAIVTHCLNGTAPDYGTLDTGDATTPDRVRRDLCRKAGARRAVMPFAGPDPAPEIGPIPEKTETPSLWKAEVVSYLNEKVTANWLEATELAAHPPRVEWDTQTHRIMTAVTCPVKKHNHQYGISVDQLAY